MPDYDVIVIGAGFAGITTARECATRGLRTLVLEARDRIGGRSGSKQLSDGTVADIGGTYVHWTQPHTWAEISRYGLHVVPGTVPPQWIATNVDGEVQWDDAAPTEAMLRQAVERIIPLSAEVFPNLAEPLANLAAVEAADQLTLAEGLAQVELTDQERAVLTATLSAYASRPADRASWSNLLRWFAMGNSDYDTFNALLMGFKLKEGTGTLAAAMLADGGSEVRLNTPATSIHSAADRVVVETDPESFEARMVVIATPPGAWPGLDLTPPLPPTQRAAAEEGMQATWSGKATAVIRGEGRAFRFQSNAELPITVFTQELRGPDEQIVVVFTGDPNIDLRDPDQVRAMIETALPHVTVVDSAGDMYLADDPALRGAWGFLSPGQLTKFRPHDTFTRLDDRVIFASSEIARLHHGFIDGAIESGLRAARDVKANVMKT